MASGIYKLTFKDGSIYIGKSVDIERRWSQHQKAMSKGTHTDKIQQAFNSYGHPVYEIILECHPDHLDILENHCINCYWTDSILNTTKPPALSKEEQSILASVDFSVWNLSTFDHIIGWSEALTERNALKDKILVVKNGQLVKKLEDRIEELENKLEDALDLNDAYSKAYAKLKSRGFFARLFNLGE